jgi:uncharacterized protein YwgA
MELQNLLSYIVALNTDSRVVGKTRLQKMIFLLDQCGLESNSRYSYHYYGPYSADIAEAAEDATLFGCLEFEEHSGFYNIPYGTYEVSDKNLHIPANIGSLDKDTVQRKINIMSNYSAIELELAATIQYLRKQGSVNAIEEVKQLKPAKATDSRMARARSLLLEMGIS